MRKRSTPLIPLKYVFSISFYFLFPVSFYFLCRNFSHLLLCTNLNASWNMCRCQHRRLLRIKWRIQPRMECVLCGPSERLVSLISSVLRDETRLVDGNCEKLWEAWTWWMNVTKFDSIRLCGIENLTLLRKLSSMCSIMSRRKQVTSGTGEVVLGSMIR